MTNLRACALATVLVGTAFAATAQVPAPLPVRVLVINMFAPEAAPWLEALQPDRDIPVPGLPEASPAVRCNAAAVCQMTTGMGHANAAASLMAVLYSGRFDLRQSYFLIAGIAGIDPARGTIGTAAWARYAVDSGIAHEIDAREIPRGWHDGYFGVLTQSPTELPKFEYQSELFELNARLAQRAYELSKSVALADSPSLRAYRAHYPLAPANEPPAVALCDTVSADTWWVGKRLGDHARRWTKLLTQGAGVYCTTQQEDNATLTAMRRAAHAGLIDFARIAVLRAGSDFDRPYPQQGVLQGLRAQLAIADAFRVATVNQQRAGMALVAEIAAHWEQWQGGIPDKRAP